MCETAHKLKAHTVSATVRTTRQNAEACFANSRIYEKLEITREFMQKLQQSVACMVNMAYDIEALDSVRFTSLEAECKAHSLKYRKTKQGMITALRNHYTSSAHGVSNIVKVPIKVKQEPV